MKAIAMLNYVTKTALTDSLQLLAKCATNCNLRLFAVIIIIATKQSFLSLKNRLTDFYAVKLM